MPISVTSRSHRGASLVLVVAIFGFVAIAVTMFCLKFTGLLGSYQEQKSAIEAAALAIAKDLSAVVIEDSNFGLVGLTDSSPVGTATSASDGFYTPVTGINTLLGTIRLDMIIADYLEDPVMLKLATEEYDKALITQKNLVAALKNSLITNGAAQDANGNVLKPMQDALKAYTANSVHLLAGQSATLSPGSLKLTLGFIQKLGTRTQIPQPPSVGSITANQQSQGFYLANQVVSYNNLPFVFAAQGANTTLVDCRSFQTTLDSLPYSTPTVIKVDADEVFSGGSETLVVHSSAAALGGGVTDQRPFPGAFTLNMPDGPPPEIVQPGDLINNVQLQADPIDIIQTPLNGDYPQTALSNYSLPSLPDQDSFHPTFQNVLSLALYDWIKGGGTHVNVESLISTLTLPMKTGTGGAQIQSFHLTSTGAVTTTTGGATGSNYCVSNKQFRALSGLAINSSNGSSYDCEIDDYTRTPGRISGGMHAGQPLNSPGALGANTIAPPYVGDTLFENTTKLYQEFLSGSGVRPTYNNEGVAVNLTLRKRQ